MLALTHLDPRDRAAVVANIAGNTALPKEIVEEIAERADGVPLFVEELTKAVLESGLEGAAALSSVPSTAWSVPATLHASLMARTGGRGRGAIRSGDRPRVVAGASDSMPVSPRPSKIASQRSHLPSPTFWPCTRPYSRTGWCK